MYVLDELSKMEFILHADSAELIRYTGDERHVIIPSSFDEKPVIKIGPKAFFGNNSMEVLEILSSNLEIGSSAFQCCSSLWKITIHSKKLDIKNHGFAACKNLRIFFAPKACTKLGQFAFGNCQKLNLMCFKGSPEYEGNTFHLCRSLVSSKNYTDGRFFIDQTKILTDLTGNRSDAEKFHCTPSDMLLLKQFSSETVTMCKDPFAAWLWDLIGTTLTIDLEDTTFLEELVTLFRKRVDQYWSRAFLDDPEEDIPF